jgi:hypothetical protein
MFEEIIERAARLKAERGKQPRSTQRAQNTKRKSAR